MKPDTLKLAEESEQLIDRLFKKGFIASSIDSVVIKKDSIVFHINLGSQFNLGELRYSGIPIDLISKAAGRTAKKPEPLAPQRISRQKEKIIRYFEDRGYPFVSVKLDSISLHDGLLYAVMVIDRGQYIKIDSVLVEGTAKVKPKYMQTYLGIKLGNPYNESRISEISARSKELPFVTEKQSPQVRFQDDKAKVILQLDKRKASQFDGILGVLPNNDDPGKVLITGELKLKLLSAFGRGELIGLQWQKLQARTQKLDVQLTLPLLFNTPFGVDGTFNLYKRDTLFLNLQGTGGILYQMRGGDFLKVFVDSRSTNVLAQSVLSQGSGTLRPEYVDSRIMLYGIGANVSRTDYRFNPRKGFMIDGQFSAGTKRIDKDPEIEPERYEGLSTRSFIGNAMLDASYFVPIAKQHTIKIGLKGAYIFAENIFENEMYRIGGLKTLRGFDEESIFTDLYSIGTIEYRFLFGPNSFGFAFFDGAYYESNGANAKVVDRPFGFGLGVNFETKIGIFSLTYALGKQFNNPIDFRAGKIHFGIVNRF